MDKDKEISDYQTKISDFLKDKKCDITIHKYSRGKNKKLTNRLSIELGWNRMKQRQSELYKKLTFSIDRYIIGEQHKYNKYFTH